MTNTSERASRREEMTSTRRRYAIFSDLIRGNYALVIRGDDIERAPKWGNFVSWLGKEKI